MKSLYDLCFVAPTVYPYFAGGGYGGAERQIVLIAKMLKKAGHRVTIVTNDYGQRDMEEHDGLPVWKLPLGFLGGSNLRLPADVCRFVRQMKKRRFDVVFMKTPNTLSFFLGLLKGSTKTVKIFASDRDCSPGGGFSGVAGRLCRVGFRRLDGFVFQTGLQKRLAAENLHVTGPVIRNLFMPSERVEAAKDIDVLWVGGFQTGKRPDRLLAVAKALPHRSFTVIAKPCPPGMKPLEAELAALDNVEYVGTVPAGLVNSFYARAKTLLCTSEVEGFPNTFLESWFNRAPVVSWQYECDGVLARYRAGAVGNDLSGSCGALEKLLDNEALRLTAADNGWKYVTEFHLEEKILPRYEEFIATLTGKKTNRPVD